MTNELVWSVVADRWRDLYPDACRAGVVTCVTTSGTARVLDLKGGRHLRQTLEGSRSPWATDGRWLPLRGTVTVCPCGIFLTTGGPRDWEASTRLWAMWAGHVPAWPETDVGQQILADVLRHRRPPTPTEEHPGQPCPLPYCILYYEAQATSV